MNLSIIIPTYNRKNLLPRAIKSVLSQTFKDFELIVVDDGSTDNTEKIVKDINDNRIIYIKNYKNLGIQRSLNKGIKQARGEYIARIDDDDTWIDPEKLYKQIKFLEKNTDYVLVGTGAVIASNEGKELFRFLSPLEDQKIRQLILGKNCFLHPSVVFKKSAVLKVGGYSEELEDLHAEDYDLWLKLGTIGKFANLPFHGISYTKWKGQITNKDQMKQLKNYFRLIRKYKKYYPGHYLALFRSSSRLVLYGYLKFRKIINMIRKIKHSYSNLQKKKELSKEF